MFSKAHVKHLPAIVSANNLIISGTKRGDKSGPKSSRFMES